MKKGILSILVGIVLLAACVKDNDPPNDTNKDCLIAKKWTFITATINPPDSYSNLDARERAWYKVMLDSLKGAWMKFEANGNLKTYDGGREFSYKWELINGGKDILRSKSDTLKSFNCNATEFNYTSGVPGLGNKYSVTYQWR